MQFLAASAHDGWFRLDPRTKLLLVITVNVAALTRVEQTAALVSFVCAAFLPVTIGSWRALGIQVLLFGICRGIQVLGTQILEGPVWQTVGAVGFFLGNFVTVLTMGVYLARSTTPSELIEGLRRLRTPDAIIIPLAVMLRFFPTLGEELTAVIQAVSLRRLHPGPWGFLREPLTTVEHIMVPFLVSATRIGDELAASALTRGLGGTRSRTTITDLRFRISDIVGLMMSFLIIFVFLKGVL